MATHSSILAWEIPQAELEEPGGLQFLGPQSQTRLNTESDTTKQQNRA